MKKLLLLLSITFVLASCSSDSDSNEINAAFIGKWRPLNLKKTTLQQGLYIKLMIIQEECYHMTTYEFKANGQFIKDSYDFDAFNCVRNPVRTYNYTYSGNTITITANEIENLIIVENTSNDLKLKVNPDNSYTIIEYSRVN